jgi:hypothetical protein
MQVRGFDPNVQSAQPLFVPGQIHIEPDGSVYEYCKANGAQTAGEFAQLTKDSTRDATPMTTTTVDSKVWDVGVACIAMTDNYFGWFWRGNIKGGEFEAVVVNAVAAGSVLTSTATAGEAGTGGTAIDGLESVDLGVTSTRVTVWAFGLLTVGKTAAYD